MLFKVWNDRGAADYDVAELAAQAGYAGPRPHVHHTHEELFYGLDGEFEFLLGDELVRLENGALIDVPPGVVHAFRNPGPGNARLLIIASPAGLDRYFEEKAALGAADTGSQPALHQLRLKYDIEEIDVAIWQRTAASLR